MHPYATTEKRQSARPAPLARSVCSYALCALLGLGTPGVLGIGVALADTPVEESVPTARQGKTASALPRITRRASITSEEQALAIALRDLGLKEADVDEIEVEFEEDEAPRHWEVELVVGNFEYEYSISPYTGAILYQTRERVGADPRLITRIVD